jgi:hypothetical protein
LPQQAIVFTGSMDGFGSSVKFFDQRSDMCVDDSVTRGQLTLAIADGLPRRCFQIIYII